VAFRVRVRYPGNVNNTENNNNSITFEHVPSDYAILKMVVLPETGGDTIWASGYEVYERLSPTWRRFAETLTATHHNVSTSLHWHETRTSNC
jgi:alpha-ketoglutarate-dependent taurine dioxygenase